MIKKSSMNQKIKTQNVIDLETFKEKHFGKRGTPKREDFEKGYVSFKINALKQKKKDQ
jgi:hypothetical protein